MTDSAQATLGRLGLPAPVADLAAQTWDVVVVGGGHNGLTAAAYLAGAGKRVLVLERNDQVGGACTLQQPFSDPAWLVSPCAYLVGLLHPLVVDELDLRRHGYRVELVDPHLWCPFEDGSSLTLWDDSERSAAEIARLAPGDVDGYLAYEALFARIRQALRVDPSAPGGDAWVGPAPSDGELESLLAGDREALDVVFRSSIAEVVTAHVDDERLHTALHGQGLIGTYAGPFEPGTAAIHLLHSLGTLEGRRGAWGYVVGGMGRVSFAIADAGREAGAQIACGVEVAEIVPGTGVRLASGETIRARAIVANTDPKRTLALLHGDAPDEFRARVDGWRCESPVVKLNCGLSRLPRFTAPNDGVTPYRSMVTISTGMSASQDACERSRLGIPSPAWCELYFQTAYDPSIAPAGSHTMSVFAQYAPYELAEGTWDTRRDEIGDLVLDTIARFAPDVHEVVEEREVLGPPDVERRVGLTGGHIFQGECLPDQMWTRRFAPRTPVPGLYLCGAATHPGGSVIGVNGRNAAMALLDDDRRD